MKKSMINPINTTRGSAILYILVAIALLAALTISLTKMSSTSSGNLEPEKARLAAQQIISYTKSIENAVQFVRTQNQCGQTQISFENPVTSGYTNASAPADKRCHIFNAVGGGMTWVPQPVNSTLVGNETWNINGWNHSITGFGSEGSGFCGANCTDLIMWLPNVEKSVCQQINFLLGVTTTLNANPPDSYSTVPPAAITSTRFVGVYGTTTGARIGGSGTTIYMKPAACVFLATGATTYRDVSGGAPTANAAYAFYQILLIR